MRSAAVQIIGAVDPEILRIVGEYYAARRRGEPLSDDSSGRSAKEIVAPFSRPLTLDERALMVLANQATNVLMRNAGVEPWDVPEENVHVVTPAFFSKANASPDALGYVSVLHQAVYIVDDGDLAAHPFAFGGRLFHEFFHLKGRTAVQVRMSRKSACAYTHRLGWMTSPGRRTHCRPRHRFVGVEEAVASAMEICFAGDLLEHPAFREDRRRFFHPEGCLARICGAVRTGTMLEDVTWISPEGEPEVCGYVLQRDALWEVCMALAERLPETFAEPADAVCGFIHAHFTGEQLPVLTAVRRVFGVEGLRALAAMGKSRTSALRTVRAFRRIKRAWAHA